MHEEDRLQESAGVAQQPADVSHSSLIKRDHGTTGDFQVFSSDYLNNTVSDVAPTGCQS
jgi:hypothetical protein